MSLDAIRLMVASVAGNVAADLFSQALAAGKIKRYVKFGVVKARPAKKGDVVITTVNGKEETRNTAKDGDILVENPGGEQYLISGTKFASRYKKIGKIDKLWTKYKPVGECFGFMYEGPSFKFNAPWNELMLVESGDMIVSTSPEGGSDIYRIEKQAFKDTYKLAGGV